MTLRCLFVDFNSYFASVEQQENVRLRGIPIGVIPVQAETTCCLAASVEAKRHGVQTGTLVRDARKLCPGIEFVLARPAKYIEWHHRLLRAIDHVIPVVGDHGRTDGVRSVDEVACELVGSQQQRSNAEELAQRIKRELRRETGGEAIRCSVGIAPNELLAKTASDMQKPDGLVVIEQRDLPDALHGLELRDLCGIGPSMESRLHALGIHSMRELLAANKQTLRCAWNGIEGERMWALLHGAWLPPRKTRRGSIGHSHVLEPALRSIDGARTVLNKLLAKAAMRLRRESFVAGALAIRIRLLDAEQRWEYDTVFDPTDDSRAFLRLLNRALREHLPSASLRPLSVSVTLHGLVPRGHASLGLFGDDRAIGALNGTIDRINGRFGHNTVYFGAMQEALARDAAPLRIPFNRIPDVTAEADAEHHPLWLESVNRVKVLAEAQHRRNNETRQKRHAAHRNDSTRP